jgi:hypothetical protein
LTFQKLYDAFQNLSISMHLLICSVSVRNHVESPESVVIQKWWPDSGRVTDVDAREPEALRPQPVALSE